NPVIIFDMGGNWDVSLTVTDFYGRTATKTISQYIHVGGSNLPYASFTISPESGIAPLTVTFTDTSTGEISSWHWDFGDESTSTERNPVHTYEEAGEYFATLQVSNVQGSTKASRKIVVKNEPHQSSLSLPGGVFYRKAGETTWQYHQIQPLADQFNCWEYTTSYQPSPQRLGPPYVVPYENYPQSAFTLVITDYNRNLILDDTYPFIYCVADEKRRDQLSFAIPDGTDMVVQAVYYESRDDSFTLAFISPIDGAIILPAMTDIRVEAKGSGLDPDHVQCIDPTGTPIYLIYNQQSGLFEGSFDATPYLGQTITLSALAERTGGYPPVRTGIAVTVSTEPVIAGFIGSPRTGTAPLTVAFLDQSKNNPTTWQWMFGDGSISTVQNPTHSYEKPGSYPVSLSVANTRSEDTITWEDYITVGDPGLVADFEVIPRSGKKPLTIAAYDLSLGDIVTWEWTFVHDSGSTPVQSFEQDPVVTLDKGGNWDVTLTVTDSGGLTATCMKKNYVHVGGPQPVLEPPIFSADPVSGNQPLETFFTVISPDTARQWYWDFGDTKTSSEKEPVHTYEMAGIYSPQLTIWSDENSATTVLPRAITVKKISDDPIALFSADPVCLVAPGKVWFTDESVGSIVSWAWDFGDGLQSDKQNPVHTYTEAGIRTVTLTVTDAKGRQDTLTRDTYITVNPAGGGTPNNALMQKTQGTISEGQTSTDTVMIDSSIDSFSTLLNWPGSILGFSLILPDGTRIITDPASQTGTTSSNVYYSSGPTFAVYDVKNSVPGEYTIEVTAYETGGDEPYAYVVISQTEVYIEAELGSEVIVPGTPIEVSARLLSGDTPITEPPLSATCITPGGSVYDIPLTLVENFSYTGRFAGTMTPGIYTVTITTDSEEVQRTAILSCESQGFVIETVAGANGSISPFGDVYVSAGDTPAFTITPDNGFRVSDLIVDDASLGPETYYQFDPIHTDHTLEAMFTPDTPVYDFVLPLSSGWNQVSIPRYPIVGQDTLGRLFGGINNDGHSIFMYNATTQSWDIPVDTHPVTPLEAYFVYSAEYLDIGIMFAREKPIDGVMLMPRWNLVGYSETNPYEARAFLASLGEAWTFILGFDAESQIYEETIIRDGTGPYSDIRLVFPGKGYWLYCEEEIFFLPVWG
ncbi:MAG: PKD domain-containing protein, partial [Methanospirillaceae archaeon]|nr:PKD domain-containing protein [Methanospirillaceae archaeon]